MKLAYISTSIIPSKTANSIHVMKMCASLSKFGCDVSLYCKAGTLIETHKSDDGDFVFGEYDVDKCFDIEFLNYSKSKVLPKSLTYSFEIYKAIKKSKVDVVFSRTILPLFFTFLFINRPFLLELHMPIESRPVIERIVFNLLIRSRNFRGLIVITQSLKSQFQFRFKKLLAGRIFVFPDGADDRALINERGDVMLKSNFEYNVGYVGGMYEGKGVDTVIRIANTVENVGFHIIGGHKEDVLAQLNNLEIGDNVFFYGYQPHKLTRQFICLFDICLLPNKENVYIKNIKSEKANIGRYTSPLKLFEYMSMKKPIIASRLDVIEEILDEGNSMLVDPENIKQWREAIIELINNPLKSRDIAKRGYDDFVNHYSWKARAAKVVDIYKNEIDESFKQ